MRGFEREDRALGLGIKIWKMRGYADEKYLMVSEYGAFGADAEIVVFKRWN